MEMSAGQGQAPLEGDLLEDQKKTNRLIAFSAFPYPPPPHDPGEQIS